MMKLAFARKATAFAFAAKDLNLPQAPPPGSWPATWKGFQVMFQNPAGASILSVICALFFTQFLPLVVRNVDVNKFFGGKEIVTITALELALQN
mmetsp:Transcript_7371/g.19195  ORF Transcript_7371/g.19195 Transcript_7371/m.19195 type:complete len:94 (+) Transcript_7371:584-865(+)